MKHDPTTSAPDFYTFAREWLQQYLQKTRGLSPNTITAYRLSLECFLGFLSESEHVDRANVTFDHFDRTHVKAWLAWMGQTRRYTPHTVQLRLTALATFLEHCSREDLTLVAPAQAIKTLKAPTPPKKPIHYLTADETRVVLAAHTGRTAKSRRNRML